MKLIQVLVGTAFLGFASILAGQAAAPTPDKKIATVRGCVTKLPNTDRYVLASGDRCYLMAGSLDGAKVADHEVTLQGAVQELTKLEPLTLTVTQTKVTGSACAMTCMPVLPGSRSVHGKPRPGPEGGPPGVTRPADTPQ